MRIIFAKKPSLVFANSAFLSGEKFDLREGTIFQTALVGQKSIINLKKNVTFLGD